MAGWRRVVELAMSDEEIATLTTLSRSRLELASRVSRARMLLAYRENPSFCAVGQRLGVHHQTVQRCVERRWPMARWQPSTIARDRARNQPSRLKPKPGWCRWRATRPRTTATRMSCGRRAFWRAMRASMGRRRGMRVWPIWSRERCARYSVKRKSSRTRCVTILKIATPSSSRRWRRCCASTVKSKS